MDKVAFISKVTNEVIEDMSELAKHCIFSKLTKQGETRRLAEILGADENDINFELLDKFIEGKMTGKNVMYAAIDGVYVCRNFLNKGELEFYDLNGKKLKDFKMDKNYLLEPFIKDVSGLFYDNRYFADDKSVWRCNVYYYETDKRLYDIPFNTENYSGDIDAIATEIKNYLEKKFDCKVEIIYARGGKDANLEFHLKF